MAKKKATKKKAKSTSGQQLPTKRPKETPVETPVMAIQPHGGALMRGNPGNKGGGRTPDIFKAMAEDATLEESIPMLRSVVRGEPIRSMTKRFNEDGKELASIYLEATPEMRDRLKAADLLLKAARPPQTAQFKAAAELDMESGPMRFTLVLGETHEDDLRDDDD